MSDPQPPWNQQQSPYGAPPQATTPLPQYGRPQSQYPGLQQPGPQSSGPHYPGPHYPRPHLPSPQHPGQQHPGQQQPGQPPYGRNGHQPLHLSHGPQYPGNHQPPNKSSKVPRLLIGAVVTVLALVAGTVAFVATRPGEKVNTGAPPPQPTSQPAPTEPQATTDPATTGPATTDPATTDPATTEPPTTDPSPPQAAGERRRTLKDIDVGILVYDDIYVAPAPGWRQTFRTEHSVTVARVNSAGLADIAVSPAGWPARLGVAQAVKEMIDADHLEGAEKGAVHTMPPANSNVLAQAEQSYTGRITTKDGVVFSFAGRCTTMTGVESVHNVTVTLCAVVRADLQKAVFKDADRMLATLARSI
ncbi:MAG TPA: hypothetical protein VG497_15985 [Kribbella sp.]|nr:hypothetical protein [Kribbella sp.]